MRLTLRACVLATAGLEFTVMVWLMLRAGILEADWSDPRAWETLWLPGIFIAPSGLAFALGMLGRGLGWAIALCTFTPPWPSSSCPWLGAQRSLDKW